MKKIISLFLLLVTPVVFAGNEPGVFTVTLADAYYHFSAKRHLDNAAMPNIALAYNFNSQWAAEFNMGVLNTDQSNSAELGVHGFLYTLDGIYRFMPRQHFEPYVLAGIGILGLKPNGNSATHQGSVNAGVGVQFFADDAIALRGEVKDLYTLSGGQNDWMVNVGVSFLMGSASPQPSPAVESSD
jgi:hypothetical protein